MSLISYDKNKSKIMLLQLRKYRKQYISILNGELLQKGSASAKKNAQVLENQIRSSMDKVNWDFVPRAKLAVRIHFHADFPNISELPKLVKYLIDILCRIICKDDMQIEFLSACCIRPSDTIPETAKQTGSIFVEVERLTDFKQKFDLFRTLISDNEFRNFADSHHHLGPSFRNDDKKIVDLWPDEETARLLNLSRETVNDLHRLTRMENQQKLLSFSKIDIHEWPDGPKNPFYKYHEKFWRLNPFFIEMDGLPTKGNKQKYKARLRSKLQKLNQRFISFGKIILPLELNVQVRLNESNLNKDLDNIMVDLLSVFTEEMLDDGSYLHGYRIYVSRHKDSSLPKKSLRFKLLPLYAINDFDDLMSKTLELGSEWLQQRIN